MKQYLPLLLILLYGCTSFNPGSLPHCEYKGLNGTDCVKTEDVKPCSFYTGLIPFNRCDEKRNPDDAICRKNVATSEDLYVYEEYLCFNFTIIEDKPIYVIDDFIETELVYYYIAENGSEVIVKIVPFVNNVVIFDDEYDDNLSINWYIRDRWNNSFNFSSPIVRELNETDCWYPGECINNTELDGCSYDGCNWCCGDICTVMMCMGDVKPFFGGWEFINVNLTSLPTNEVIPNNYKQTVIYETVCECIGAVLHEQEGINEWSCNQYCYNKSKIIWVKE